MDTAIKAQFDRCEAEGLCRSDVAGLRMKWIPGSKHFVAQYHPTWQLVKRKPFFTRPRVDEPFSSEGFNFTKVNPTELLAKIYVKDGKVYFVDGSEIDVPTIYTILLNVSPICNNHHLIIPNLENCYNQVWKYDLTEDFVTMCENSERDDYVLFFNSLGGFSSVNHFHLQVMYTSSFYATIAGNPQPPLSDDFTVNRLPLEYAPCHILYQKGSVTVSDVCDWMCQTVKLSVDIQANDSIEVKETKRKELCTYFNDLIRLCYKYQYPYDVVFCQHGRDIYVFVRKYQQPLEDLCVNPACVELTGIVVYRSEKCFNEANEEILMKRCREVVYYTPDEWRDFLNDFLNRIKSN